MPRVTPPANRSAPLRLIWVIQTIPLSSVLMGLDAAPTRLFENVRGSARSHDGERAGESGKELRD